MNGAICQLSDGGVPGERADLPEAVLVERLAVDQREALDVGDQREADRRARRARAAPASRRCAPRPDAVDDHRGDRRAERRRTRRRRAG